MRKHHLIRWAFFAFLLIPAAHPQTPTSAWTLNGTVRIDGRMRSLPAADQQGIQQILALAPDSLRVARVRTPAGQLFVVQANGRPLCGDTGNCSSWILGSDFTVLLSTPAQAIRIQPAPGNTFDIVTSTSSSTFAGMLKRWHYDGHTYRRTACAAITYSGPDGKPFPQPQIKPAPCR